MACPQSFRAMQLETILAPCSFTGVLMDSPRDMTYRFRGFKCPYRLIRTGFNWGYHIEQSFHDCMKPMTDKFMKVV